jgi:hypothetical protein
MFKNFALTLSLVLSFQSLASAQEDSATTDKMIGATFKALAKAFVLTTDIDRLKRNNIGALERMDDEKFKKRYAEVYEVIKALPTELKSSYRITESMPKGQAIRDINSLDKKKLYGLIDAVPDAIIAQQFKQYLSETKQKILKHSLVMQVTKTWNKITATALSSPK